MKVSALEEYGLRCLLRVARQTHDEPISAQAIAEAEGLSLPYAQKIMRVLSLGGLVESRRGAQGGYVLPRAASRISLGDAMRVLGGLLETEDICERHTGELNICSNNCNCAIRPIWAHISEFVIRTLDNVPLSVLLQNEEMVEQHLHAIYDESARASKMSDTADDHDPVTTRSL